MKFLKTVLRIILVILVLSVLNRWYLGGFSQLEVKEQAVGPYTLAYMNFTGEYAKVWPTMDEVYTMLSWAGIVSYTGIGIYYDDPSVVSGSDLRSDIGAIVTTADAAKLTQGLSIKTIDTAQRMIIEFPFKNSISIMAGVIKVYPLLKEYMKAKWYTSVPITELYATSAKKIYYIADIVK